LFCLPNNCTQELQSLDTSVFDPSDYWDPAVWRYLNHGERNASKTIFCYIFSDVWMKFRTRTTHHVWFYGTRIYPFNDDVIPDSAFAPSGLTFLQSFEEEGYWTNLTRAATVSSPTFQSLITKFQIEIQSK
jgi:hypothetical protein